MSNKDSTFAYASAVTMLNLAAQGAPVLAVATIDAQGTDAVLVDPDSGIRTFKDLEGKSVLTTAGAGVNTLFPVVARNAGADPEKIKLTFVAESALVPSYLQKLAPAMLGGIDDKPAEIKSAGGKPPIILNYADYGVSQPGYAIVAHRDTAEKSPDLVRRFVRATLRAVAAAKADPDAAIDALVNWQASVADQRAQARDVLDVTLSILRSKNATDDRLGVNVAADWESALEILKTYKELRTDRPATAFYTNDFIPTSLDRSATPPMTVRVVLEGVAKVFPGPPAPVAALGPVDLVVEAGSFVALLGPSGCGKSTLLMMIAGLIEASAGRIAIGGRPVEGPQTAIGIVFQSPVLVDWRDVLGNVLLQTDLRGLERAIYRERARELLASVGLADFASRRPYELSGGMQQRVALLPCLGPRSSPRADGRAPGALDAMTREQLRGDLERLWMRTRKTVILVTHSIEEAVQLADRVLVVSPRPGRLVRDVTVDLPRPRSLEVCESPAFHAHVAEIKRIFHGYGLL